MTEAQASSSSRQWTFLTNHGHAIIYLNSHPDARIRDIAAVIGITERAAQAILSDLEADGYITKTKIGRRNHYELHDSLKFRHPVEAGHKVSELLEIFSEPTARLAQ
jgi:DNA-binding MarR family transcriptional regulator